MFFLLLFSDKPRASISRLRQLRHEWVNDKEVKFNLKLKTLISIPSISASTHLCFVQYWLFLLQAEETTEAFIYNAF